MTMSIVVISLLLLLSHVVEAQSSVFDVTKYGANGNGNADISQALLSAWKDACASTTPSTVLIPKGSFLLNEVAINGPCKAPVEIQLQGTLKAPADPKQFKGDGWLTFGYIDLLTMSGGGTFDGQGAMAWSMNDCSTNKNCPRLAVSLRFNFVTNSLFHDVTSLDSKNFHVTLTGCKNVTFQHFTITAPETSINTDGIHIGYSTDINIIDSNIQTGDDCVSIGDGSKQINIEKVTCGPGHGISVGSLGKSNKVERVSGITVRNCTLTKTMNGVRIKTWPSSRTDGFASDMHFEDIIVNNVGNPVLIDQEYCPSNLCSLQTPSRVKISNVSFKNVRGTSATQVAVKLVCSKSLPCENVEVGDIDLTYSGPEGPATSQCTNIQPKLIGKQNPPTCVGSSQSS